MDVRIVVITALTVGVVVLCVHKPWLVLPSAVGLAFFRLLITIIKK